MLEPVWPGIQSARPHPSFQDRDCSSRGGGGGGGGCVALVGLCETSLAEPSFWEPSKQWQGQLGWICKLYKRRERFT